MEDRLRQQRIESAFLQQHFIYVQRTSTNPEQIRSEESNTPKSLQPQKNEEPRTFQHTNKHTQGLEELERQGSNTRTSQPKEENKKQRDEQLTLHLRDDEGNDEITTQTEDMDYDDDDEMSNMEAIAQRERRTPARILRRYDADLN
jgi:hypothetical protein